MKFKNIKKKYLQSESQKDRRAIEKDDAFEPLSQILFVIVLYKVNTTESITFQSLSVAVKSLFINRPIDLLICDNSPTPQLYISDLLKESHLNTIYLHDQNNPGISLSYNRAVELATEKGKKWILVLDQDTTLPISALKSYLHGLKTWPELPIYTPQVYSNKILLSPCRYFMHRGSPLLNIQPGIHLMKGKNVINSGLLINIEAYKLAGGYDEKVWLYFSDFVFFDRLKTHYDKFVVLDLRIDHELSSSDYSNFSFAASRFRYYCEGAKAASLSNGTFNAYLGYGVTTGLRSILMCRRFKSMIFVKIFFKNFLLKRF